MRSGAAIISPIASQKWLMAYTSVVFAGSRSVSGRE